MGNLELSSKVVKNDLKRWAAKLAAIDAELRAMYVEMQEIFKDIEELEK